MPRCNFKLTLAAPLLFWALAGHADTVIEYSVAQGQRNSQQPVMIKDGAVLVKGAGGDGNLDFLYEQGAERIVLIDHRKQRYTPVTDERVRRIVRQAEELRPVLRGLSEQLRGLPPKQREKWERMPGGVSLDQFESAERIAASTQLRKTGAGKQFAGIRCELMELIKSGAKSAEFCLADPAALKLPAEDASTLKALVQFTQKLAQEAQDLTRQFGVGLPAEGIAGLAGLPIEVRDFSGKQPLAVTLSGVNGAAIQDALKIPAGYREKSLQLW